MSPEPEHHHQISPRDWRARLFVARTDAEVVGTANAFIESFTSDEFASIGRPSGVAAFHSAADIVGFAYDLATRREPYDEKTQMVVGALVMFFNDAASRLALLSQREHSLRETA